MGTDSHSEPGATARADGAWSPEGLDQFLERVAPFTEIEAWTQDRTGSSCRVLRSEALGIDAFLKQVPERQAGDVAVDFGCLATLHREAPGVVPEPLGWGTSPPYLASATIAGPLVSERLTRAGSVHGMVADLVASCGRGLARIHSVPIASLPAKVRLRDDHVGSAAPVASIVDLGPWNCLVDGEDVVFIDVQLRLATPEFDVGRMSVALTRAVARGCGPVVASQCAWSVARTLHGGYERGRAAVDGTSVSVPRASAVAVRKALTLLWSDLRRRNSRPVALAVGLIVGELAFVMQSAVRRLARTSPLSG